MAYTPLASSAQMQATQFTDLIRDMAAPDVDTLMARASRAVESLCRRRLAPFTNLIENSRANAIDVEDATDFMVPLDPTAQLGLSRAQSLGVTGLVRHAWVRQFPPLYEELWTTTVNAITIIRSFSGSQTVDPATITVEPDLGHIRFRLGTFIPPGSTIVINYSGGYTVQIPEDLVEACCFSAARIALRRIEPQARPEISDTELIAELEQLTEPYWRS